MITEIEVKELLEKNVPQMESELSGKNGLYKTVEGFANFTKDLIKTGNLPLLKECFNTAEYLLKEGSSEVKNAIENVFVFSIGSFLDLTGAVSRQVKELLPLGLMKEYKRQINSCSI